MGKDIFNCSRFLKAPSSLLNSPRDWAWVLAKGSFMAWTLLEGALGRISVSDHRSVLSLVVAPALAVPARCPPAACTQQQCPAQGRWPWPSAMKERERRHQLATGKSCFKSTLSQIAHYVNVGQPVVSFSFLIQLGRLWHVLMWEFFLFFAYICLSLLKL